MVARINQHVGLVQSRLVFDGFGATTGWTALSNDTTGLATDLSHILGAVSIEFDKVDGAANKKYAGIYRTLSPTVNASHVCGHDELAFAVYCSNATDVDYAFVRIGTDASHYNEWRVADTDIASGVWSLHRLPLADTEVAITGNGWSLAALAYLCVGVMFDLETNTLADIRFDHVAIVSGQVAV